MSTRFCEKCGRETEHKELVKQSLRNTVKVRKNSLRLFSKVSLVV